MGRPIKAPYLSAGDIRRMAAEFLGQHHPELTIPIPIEEIVERELGLDIVPTPGLRDAIDVAGFITSDLSEIWVDERVFTRHEQWYRSILAHEVAHRIVHPEVYRDLEIRSIDDYKELLAELTETKEEYWLEWQAREFAGQVLVPPESLRTEFGAIADVMSSMGFDVQEEQTEPYVIAHLRDEERFNVTDQTMEIRLRKEGLIQPRNEQNVRGSPH